MNAQQLKDSILQYAMQGKLVPQDKNDEPAIKLVERISQQKNRLVEEKVLKKEKLLLPISEDEIPFDIPESWEWVRIRDVVQLINGRAYKRSELLNDNKLTPVLRVGNLFTNKSWYYSDLILPEDKYCEDGDLLYAWSASFGPHIWTGERSIFHYHIWKVRLFEENLKKYIYYHLLKDAREIKRSTTGSTMVHITKERMEGMLIPIPPLEEQKRIVIKIEEFFAKIDGFENKNQELDKLNNLFPQRLENSILHYAMQGKLVEQDPSDEPAAELVKLIREEKIRLIKEKVMKKEKDLSPITDEEIPFDIPESWEWIRVSEICRVNPKNQLEDEKEAGFIPMKLIEDGLINNHSYELRKWREIKKGYTHFQTGDIVIAKITPCFENLKSAIIRGLPNNTGAGTTELFVLRPYLSNIDKNYLLWIFKSSYFIKGGVSSFSGTAGQQRVSRNYIENLVIPLPPLNEQKRIVEKINSLRNKIQIL